MAGYETSGAKDYYPLDKLSALAELEDRIERGGQGTWEDGFPATEAG